MDEVLIIFIPGLTPISSVQKRNRKTSLPLETRRTENRIFIKMEVFGQHLPQESIRHLVGVLTNLFWDFAKEIKHVASEVKIAL